ncbi:MAG TPA: tetratricopeptide repeat protein, partial [Gemmataceae bacterium]|nr:tetratricopeptide repeat protein [Gemmataceae bacterium]
EEYEQALQEYTEALRLAPDCLTAYLERGRLYRSRGQLDQAIADFTAVLGIDDANSEAYLRRGHAYTGKREFEAAIADYDMVISLAPEFAMAYVRRGLAFANLGEFDRVIADADQALQIDPRLIAALYIRGAAYFKQEHTELALADFDMLLLLDPKHAPAYNERGLVHAARGEYEEAIADYSQALRLDPKFELALFNRAIAYRLGGKLDRALAELSGLIVRSPANASAYYQRGLVYFDHKDYDRAIADLTRAFQIDPQCKEAYSSCLEALRAKREHQQTIRVSSAEEKPARVEPLAETVLQGNTLHAEEPDSSRSESRQSRPNRGEETKSAPPERPRREEPPSPAVIERKRAPDPVEIATETNAAPVGTDTTAETKAAEGAARMVPKARRSAVTVGKLRLECPTCGVEGLLDVSNLKRAFRCPGCGSWWHADAAGRLVEAMPAGEEVEVWSTSGRSTHRLPSEEKTAAASKPSSPPKLSPPKRPAFRPRPRPSSQGRFGVAGSWIAETLATRGGRWGLGVAVILLIAWVGLTASPFVRPNKLMTRGHKMVRAWLARDLQKIEPYTDPDEKSLLASWLKKNPPPNLAGQDIARDVRVSIEGNNGRAATVVVSISAKDERGQPAHYVFRHRWTEEDGDWYFHPREANARPGSGGNKTPPSRSRFPIKPFKAIGLPLAEE